MFHTESPPCGGRDINEVSLSLNSNDHFHGMSLDVKFIPLSVRRETVVARTNWLGLVPCAYEPASLPLVYQVWEWLALVTRSVRCDPVWDVLVQTKDFNHVLMRDQVKLVST
jgi:hypothetical protein